MNMKLLSTQFYGYKLFLIVLACATIQSCANRVSVNKQFKHAGIQTQFMLQVIDSAKKNVASKNLVSPRTTENGNIKLVKGTDWTSGFFPGELWFLYEQTGSLEWLREARKFTALLEPVQFYGGTHDLGFMMYCSFGNGFRLTGDTAYQRVIIQSAKTLSGRFNAVAGVIKSWDFSKEKWKYPVIVDNMMNLELLFEATKLTQDSSFYKIAVRHANTTMKNHFRSDNSSYHVIDYDPETGQVLQKLTSQGHSDASAWARGQAWGLYGYVTCYRATKNKEYLQQAEKIAAYILSRLPSDKIPFWDFDAPAIPNEPRDASAAAIIASALYELNTFSRKKTYLKTADEILKKLATSYVSPSKMNGGFLLLHSTGHKPANSEIDVPLVYADYYFLEAMKRSKLMR